MRISDWSSDVCSSDLEGLFVEGAFDFESGIKAGEHLLTQGQRPTAIFATNDDMALGALTVAHRLTLRVPEDLSVVGFDDTPAGLTAWPPLTPVSQPPEAMGSAVHAARQGGAAAPTPFRHRLGQRDRPGPGRGR